MDKVVVKLECLKLAASRIVGRDPQEIVTLAKCFESYIYESTTCSPSKDGQESGTSEQKPIDSVKAHNKHSKK